MDAMKKFYTYKAFGLIIQSEFAIPEFIESTGVPEIQIKKSNVPDRLHPDSKKGVRYEANKNEFLLHVDQTAWFYVKNGNEIIVEPSSGRINKKVRLFLLGSVFGALFIQRGLIPIHGSSIKIGNSAIIFSGASGVGKSSIAACFVQKGYPFLSDDISIIDENFCVVPSFPKLKLWKDILRKLNIDKSSLAKVRPEIKKYHFSLHSMFFENPLPLSKIFIINPKNTPGFECTELKGIQKFEALKANTYRFRFVDGLQQQTTHFQLINMILPNTKVYAVLRPQSPVLLNELADFIIENLTPNE
jgi:hypothetical protein